MKNNFSKIAGLLLGIFSGTFAFSQATPDVLHYRFNGSDTSVLNLASNPPAGTAVAIIRGGLTQGGTGACGTHALVGSGNTSNVDYLETGWNTDLSGSWTISFWTSNIQSSSTLFYVFGDLDASSFRCFTNGVAGPGNWILRGPFPDIYINGGATTNSNVCTFVRDSAAGALYAYLNGALVSTVNTTNTITVSPGQLKVGGYSTSVGLPQNGLMDEFRFYKRALTPQEVAQISYGNQTSSTMTESLCATQYISPSGKVWTTSGTFLDTLPNGQGCDSIITVNLALHQASTSSISPAACNSYTSPSGKIWTISGSYQDTIPNAAGCDSVITVHLTINSPSSSSITPETCNSYTSPSGKIWTISGSYRDTISNAAGCDSVITVHLTINSSSSSSITPETCNSYTSPSGKIWTISGSYQDTIPNAAGCDSVITIHLTINSPSSSSITPVACSSYTSPSGKIWTISGSYLDTIPNTAGCDSIISIDLAIVNVNTTVTQNGFTLTADLAGATYQWLDCGNNYAPLSGANSQTYTADANGDYAVEITSNSCVDTSACFTITGVGFKELSEAGISVYPNPTQDKVFISFNNTEESALVRLVDLKGQIIQEVKGRTSEPVQLDIRSYSAGVYYLEIQVSGNVYRTRITRQ